MPQTAMMKLTIPSRKLLSLRIFHQRGATKISARSVWLLKAIASWPMFVRPPEIPGFHIPTAIPSKQAASCFVIMVESISLRQLGDASWNKSVMRLLRAIASGCALPSPTGGHEIERIPWLCVSKDASLDISMACPPDLPQRRKILRSDPTPVHPKS